MAYFKKHLIPSLEILAFISLLWLIQKAPFGYFLELFLGFIIGNSIIEADHLIYWYYLDPSNQESKIARQLIKNKKVKSLLKLMGETVQFHTSLIFHHVIFQLVFLVIIFFVFTSTSSITGKSTVFFLNINLLIKQLFQLFQNPSHLQKCLFARLDKQLPKKQLAYYVYLLTGVNLIFLVKLIAL